MCVCVCVCVSFNSIHATCDSTLKYLMKRKI